MYYRYNTHRYKIYLRKLWVFTCYTLGVLLRVIHCHTFIGKVHMGTISNRIHPDVYNVASLKCYYGVTYTYVKT